MTNKDMEKRFSDIEGILLKLTEEKPSGIRKFWDRFKPYIVPFILGMMVGTFSAAVCGLPSAVFTPQTPIEQQAALGGAVIPFPNGNPSPSPLYALPRDSKAERNGGVQTPSLTNISEPPSPPNPPVDNGQTRSTRLFRLPLRPTP